MEKMDDDWITIEDIQKIINSVNETNIMIFGNLNTDTDIKHIFCIFKGNYKIIFQPHEKIDTTKFDFIVSNIFYDGTITKTFDYSYFDIIKPLEDLWNKFQNSDKYFMKCLKQDIINTFSS